MQKMSWIGKKIRLLAQKQWVDHSSYMTLIDKLYALTCESMQITPLTQCFCPKKVWNASPKRPQKFIICWVVDQYKIYKCLANLCPNKQLFTNTQNMKRFFVKIKSNELLGWCSAFIFTRSTLLWYRKAVVYRQTDV